MGAEEAAELLTGTGPAAREARRKLARKLKKAEEKRLDVTPAPPAASAPDPGGFTGSTRAAALHAAFEDPLPPPVAAALPPGSLAPHSSPVHSVGGRRSRRGRLAERGEWRRTGAAMLIRPRFEG